MMVGMSGSGKTVAAQHYLEQFTLPATIVDLSEADDGGVEAIELALRQLALPATYPEEAIAQLTSPTIVLIERLERVLNQHGTVPQAVERWLVPLLTNPAVHIVITTQIIPLMPAVSNLLGTGLLKLVDGRMLAFTDAEGKELWRLHQEVELSDEEAQRLVGQTGGLAILVALSCAGGLLPAEMLDPLWEHQISRIIQTLPQKLGSLVPRIAILETVTPEALEALTDQRPGTLLMRQLMQRGLLTTDQHPTLHPILRTRLLEELRADEATFRETIQRAMQWLLGEGEHEQAWRMVRRWGNWDLARELIQTVGPGLREQGTSGTLIGWIKALPEAERGPKVRMLYARAQADVGDYDGAITTLAALRAQERDPRQRCELTIWLANMKRAAGQLHAADVLIMPYLDDQTLAPDTLSRMYRIHAEALAGEGHPQDALSFAQRAIDAAHESGDRRAVALAFEEGGVIAGRLGRYSDAEQMVRLAVRSWRELNSPVKLSLALNTQAMIALTRRNYLAAIEHAQESRVHALGAGRLREAALASSTSGDVALALNRIDEALNHYAVAAEEAYESGDLAIYTHSLVFQAVSSWINKDAAQASLLLDRLETLSPASDEERCLVLSGLTTSQLTLGLPGDLDELQHVLAQAGRHSESRMLVALLVAQVEWLAGQPAQALNQWAELERLLGGVETRPFYLVPAATALPELVAAALKGDHGPFARRIIAERPELLEQPTPVLAAPATKMSPLTLLLLGAEDVRWEGQSVELPKHGLDLLVLLLLAAPYAREEEDLLRQIWGEGSAGSHALRKLIVRLHKVMPGIIKRSGSSYSLALSRDEVDFDLSTLLNADLNELPTRALADLAEAASTGLLTEHDAPWARIVREQIRRRLALTWLELGRRFASQESHPEAANAYDRALQADPTSDIVTRAAMQHALAITDRTRAIQCFQIYKRALDEVLGVDPARDLQQLYRQALEP